MNKVKRLEKGDKIAVLSPSKGLPNLFPHVFDKGLENLKKMGFEIIEYPTARKSIEYLHTHPKERAEDINEAFANNEIKGIFTSIGGDDSVRILKYINTKVIKENPKFFMGFSDTTTMNTYFNQLGIVSFNGPSVMAGIAQIDKIQGYQQAFEDFIFGKWNSYSYKPFAQYADGYLDWKTGKVDLKELKSSNWKFGKGNAQGELFGGCIEVLNFINGTEFWPEKSFWKNKILFIETSEEKPSPDYVKYTLRNFGVQGILDNIGGLLVGRARDYSEEDKNELVEVIELVLRKEFGREIPVISNMDFGHTDPQIILPLGVKASIDCDKQEFKLLESPFL